MKKTYGDDVAFFKAQKIGFVELSNTEEKDSRVLVIPNYQGRVMTSTAGGEQGDSFGWINQKLIASGVISPKFNAFGGEERFWLGPEGGAFSWYFKPGVAQTYEHWNVPSLLDTESFDCIEHEKNYAFFRKGASLTNASGTVFHIDIRRKITVLPRSEMVSSLGMGTTPVPKELKYVAYRTENTLSNRGNSAWEKKSGLPSIWLLGMFNPSPSTTVFIPYNTKGDGPIVNDEYFGKVPKERLIVEDGMIYFKIDGKFRSKIGLPQKRAKGLCASYDSEKKILTILAYNQPSQTMDYVNSQWGEQKDPFNGDVINSYNDGPTEDGTIMGPFYEVETSSPGAQLKPGESITHTQSVFHLQGDEALIGSIVNKLFGVELNKLASKFQ